MKKDLKYYMQLKYPIEIVECEEGGYFAQIPLLRGCMTQGETLDEIMSMISGAKRGWLEVALKHKIEIPEPENGKEEHHYIIRVPKALGNRLAKKAKRERKDFDEYVLQKLTE
jgi:antitoxin HicB